MILIQLIFVSNARNSIGVFFKSGYVIPKKRDKDCLQKKLSMEYKSNPDIFVKKVPDTQILIYADLSQ